MFKIPFTREKTGFKKDLGINLKMIEMQESVFYPSIAKAKFREFFNAGYGILESAKIGFECGLMKEFYWTVEK